MKGRTRLVSLCEGVIEAAWLVALVTIPLVVNPYSNRVFEGEKVTMLRALAWLALAAWGLKAIVGARDASGAPGEERGNEGIRRSLGSILKVPLVAPVLLLVFIQLLASLLSLAPHLSWWGSYHRLQGGLTFCSVCVLFFLLLAHLRTDAQWRRIRYAIVVTSVPVSVYGIMQAAGLDPQPWAAAFRDRAGSTLGNPIFVAAYLMMAVFVTLDGLCAHFLYRRRGAQSGPRSPDWGSRMAAAVCLLTALLLQLTALGLSQSRGPVLGLLAGLSFFALAAPLLLGDRNRGVPGPSLRRLLRTWLLPAAVGIAGLLLLLAASARGWLPKALKDNHYAGRLSSLLDPESPSSRFRTLAWETAVEMLGPHRAIDSPGEGVDRLHRLRPLIGYGPETTDLIAGRFSPPELGRYETPFTRLDRLHNRAFDTLVTTGFLGLAAYFWLWTSIFYLAAKTMGLVRSRSRRRRFWMLQGSLALLGALLPYALTQSFAFAGLGLAGGMLLAFVGFAVAAAFVDRRGPRTADAASNGPSRTVLWVVAALIAHFVEIQFGVPIAATRIHFWALCALLVVAEQGWLLRFDGPSAGAVRGRLRTASEGSAAAATPPSVYSVLCACALVTLAFGFLVNWEQHSHTAELILFSLTRIVRDGQVIASPGVLVLFAATWLFAASAGATELGRRKGGEARARGFRAFDIIAFGSLLVLISYSLLHAGRLVRGAALTKASAVERASDHAAVHFTTYWATLVLLTLTLGLLLGWRANGHRARSRAGPAVVAVVGLTLVALTAYAIERSALRPIAADTHYKQAQAFLARGQLEASILLAERASEMVPAQDEYALFRGRAEVRRAELASAPEARDAALRRALGSFQRAFELSPLRADHLANLGRLYRAWGQLTEQAGAQRAKWRQAIPHYARALDASPNSAPLLNEVGALHRLLGDHRRALELHRRALRADPGLAETYLNLAHLQLAASEGEPETQALEERYAAAKELYERAAQLAPEFSEPQRGLADLYTRMGHSVAAAEAGRKAEMLHHLSLSKLHREAGQYHLALDHAEKARKLASEEEQRALQELIEELARRGS